MKKMMDFASYEKKADENSYLYFDKINCEGSLTTSPHFHDSIEVVLVTKGKCLIHINGTENMLNEGDFAFIDRFDVHYYTYFKDSSYFVLLISKKYVHGTDFDKKKLDMYLPGLNNKSHITDIFDNAYSMWEESNETFKKGFVNIVLGALSSAFPLTERQTKGEVQVLANTLTYINENFDKEISLEFLSNKFGYSKNYFSTLFNKFTGTNLREYINQRRICEYERLKSEQSELPVYVLAEKCGFSSLKTFYRALEKNRNF